MIEPDGTYREVTTMKVETERLRQEVTRWEREAEEQRDVLRRIVAKMRRQGKTWPMIARAARVSVEELMEMIKE